MSESESTTAVNQNTSSSSMFSIIDDQCDFSIKNVKEEIVDVSDETLFIKSKAEIKEELKCYEDMSRNTAVIKDEIDIKYNEIKIEEQNKMTMQSDSHEDHIPGSSTEDSIGLPVDDGFMLTAIQTNNKCVNQHTDDVHKHTFTSSNAQINLQADRRPHTCKECKESFTSKECVTNHMMSHCTVTEQRHSMCGKIFNLFYFLKDFTKTQKQIQHMCNVCHMAFTSKSGLQRHLVKHYKKRTCNNCGKHFNSHYSLKLHFKFISIVRNFTCNICKHSFTKKLSIFSHMNKHCTHARTCEFCSKSFASESHLSRHLRIHSRVNIFSCETCRLSFKSKFLLSCHIRVHDFEKMFSCEICKMFFESKCKLIKHLLNHPPEKKFTCKICSASFNSKFNLRRHKHKHGLLTEAHKLYTTYICDYCGKAFHRKRLLLDHIDSHNGAKLCAVCGKAFTKMSGLERHVLHHVELETSTCKICPQTFNNFSDLYVHVFNHVSSQ